MINKNTRTDSVLYTLNSKPTFALPCVHIHTHTETHQTHHTLTHAHTHTPRHIHCTHTHTHTHKLILLPGDVRCSKFLTICAKNQNKEEFWGSNSDFSAAFPTSRFTEAFQGVRLHSGPSRRDGSAGWREAVRAAGGLVRQVRDTEGFTGGACWTWLSRKEDEFAQRKSGMSRGRDKCKISG